LRVIGLTGSVFVWTFSRMTAVQSRLGATLH